MSGFSDLIKDLNRIQEGGEKVSSLAGTVKELSKVMETTGKTNPLSGLINGLNAVYSRQEAATKAFSATDKVMGAAMKRYPAVGGAVKSLSNPCVVAAEAVMHLGEQYVECAKKALVWHHGMASMNSTLGLTKAELNQLSDQLLHVGTQHTGSLENVKTVFHELTKAGMNTHQAMTMLDANLKLIHGNFLSMEKAVELSDSLLKEMGEEATKAYDVLFATSKAGKVNMEELSGLLPEIISGARKAGMEIGEAAGYFAYLSNRIGNAKTASSGLNMMIDDMTRLSNLKGNKVQSLLGISLKDEEGNAKQLAEVIAGLATTMENFTQEERVLKLQKAGFGEAAYFLSDMVGNAGLLEDTLVGIAQSQGAFKAAAAEMAAPMDSWKQIGNYLDAFRIKIGETSFPFIQEMGNTILEIIHHVQDLYQEFQPFRMYIDMWGRQISFIFKLLIYPIRQSLNLMKLFLQTTKWVLEKLSEAGIGINELFRKVQPYIETIRDVLWDILGMAYDLLTFDFSGFWDKLTNLGKPKNNVYVKREWNGAAEKTGGILPPETPGTRLALLHGGEEKPHKASPVGRTPAAIAAGGEKTTHISIHLGKLVEQVNISRQGFRESAEHMREIVLDEMMRVLAMSQVIAE